MGIVAVIIFVAIILLIKRLPFTTPKDIGNKGEERVRSILEQLPEDYYTFNDLLLEKDKGYTQIDHLVVSKYGVFAIETKNYAGDIYGDDRRKEWTQLIVNEHTFINKPFKTYNNVTKNKLYNPIKQSYGHIYELKKILKDWPYLKVIPIVVFIERANLQGVTSNHHVIYSSHLLETIESYKTVYLNDDDVKKIILSLIERNKRAEVDDSTHVIQIKTAKLERDIKIAEHICPKCGGDLILREGKYGKFYGCSNYPSCDFTHHVRSYFSLSCLFGGWRLIKFFLK